MYIYGIVSPMNLITKYCNNAATTAMLMNDGIQLMRQNIKRRHPHNTERQTEMALRTWLYRTDDPIPGDTAGSVQLRN